MPSAEAAVAAAASVPTPPPRQGSGTHSAARGASSTAMEFRNVVFNAARDGKLRRLKVRWSTTLEERVSLLISLMLDRYGESLSEKRWGWGV